MKLVALIIILLLCTNVAVAFKSQKCRIPFSFSMDHYQVAMNVTYEENMNANFSDLRMYTSNNDSIHYWIENQVNSSWVKLHLNITNPNNDIKTIYARYGTGEGLTSSNGSMTWDFFEDYPGTSINTQVWNTSTTHPGWSNTACLNFTVANSVLTVGRYWAAPDWCLIFTNNSVVYMNDGSVKVLQKIYQSTVTIDGSNGIGMMDAFSSDYFTSSSLFTGSYQWRSYLGTPAQTYDKRDMWTTKQLHAFNTSGTMSYYGADGEHINPNISLQSGGSDGSPPIPIMPAQLAIYHYRGEAKVDWWAVGPAVPFVDEPSVTCEAEVDYPDAPPPVPSRISFLSGVRLALKNGSRLLFKV